MKFPEFLPCSAKESCQILWKYKKGADRCIYLHGALDSLKAINANDPRPNTGNQTATNHYRLLKYAQTSHKKYGSKRIYVSVCLVLAL